MLKEALLAHCKAHISDNLNLIKGRLNDIQEAFQSETKSSAGDKYETSRAMLQIDREKLSGQFTQNKELISVLEQINPKEKLDFVKLGSIVYTSQFNYFISISLGKIILNDELFYAIGPSTPIGRLLLDQSISSEINFNNQKITIQKII